MSSVSQFSQSIFSNLLIDIEGLLTIDTLITSVTIYLLVVWLACIIWVIKDITSRSHNLIVQVLSILLVICFTPLFGLPIYLLIRPKTTLFEQFYEESSLSTLSQKESRTCNSCGEVNSSTAKYCSACGNSLELICKYCTTPLIHWATFCYHCGKSTLERVILKPKIPTKKKALEWKEVQEIQL